ncbi:hypothetical protein Tco_0871757 [Tanacetum coccineum]
MTFTDRSREVTFKTPYKDPERSELTSDGHDLLSSRIILSEDDYDRGCERPFDLESGFYKDVNKLGPEYQAGTEDKYSEHAAMNLTHHGLDAATIEKTNKLEDRSKLHQRFRYAQDTIWFGEADSETSAKKESMKTAFKDMLLLHELGEVNLTHAYYNGSRTSQDKEDPR